MRLGLPWPPEPRAVGASAGSRGQGGAAGSFLGPRLDRWTVLPTARLLPPQGEARGGTGEGEGKVRAERDPRPTVALTRQPRGSRGSGNGSCHEHFPKKRGLSGGDGRQGGLRGLGPPQHPQGTAGGAGATYI